MNKGLLNQAMNCIMEKCDLNELYQCRVVLYGCVYGDLTSSGRCLFNGLLSVFEFQELRDDENKESDQYFGRIYFTLSTGESLIHFEIQIYDGNSLSGNRPVNSRSVSR